MSNSLTNNQAADRLEQLAKQRQAETNHRESFLEAYENVCTDPQNADLYKIASDEQLTDERLTSIAKNVVGEADDYEVHAQIQKRATEIQRGAVAEGDLIPGERAMQLAEEELKMERPFDKHRSNCSETISKYEDFSIADAQRTLDELAHREVEKSGGKMQFLDAYERVCDSEPALLKAAIG